MVKVTILILFCSIFAGSEAQELKVVIERNVPVPMRDGTILRADVHRPDRGGRYPVLLERTRYGKDRGNFNRLVKAGYIVVVQDGRGSYESEGKYNLEQIQIHEAEDGYDTVEWAAKLHGSSHKVGTFGVSWLATTQWLLAPLRPPSLVAMCAESAQVHARDTYPTGAFSPANYLYGNLVSTNQRRRANLPGVHMLWEDRKLWQQGESDKWLNFLPWFELPREMLNEDRRNFLNNPSFESLDLLGGCKDISVPNFDISGWYDFCNGDMLMFRAMVNKAKTKVARKGTRIIIGPWTHQTRGARRVGGFDFGPDASLDRVGLIIRWFDYWLKGIQNGVDKDAPVRIFVMGDNKWRDEQYWPLERTKERVLFITSGGHANAPSGDGKLAQQEPKQAGTDQYLYDPKNPVPTLFDPPIYFLFPNDQRPLADRKDILVYQSEPFTERVEVTGNPVVEFYAASSAPDTDWFVRLIDVAPDGLARNVSDGVVRARYRNGFDEPKFLKSGEVVKYTIRMRSTANAFHPGHRIRLDITSSDFPNYDRNHNTATNQNADATLVVANQTIYHGGERATRIILPWVPNPVEEEKPVEKEKSEPEPKKQIYHLHQAAKIGDIEQVKLLISKGADVNAKDEREKTPLCHAVTSGKMELIKLLVEAGADVNTGKWPPLCQAVDENNMEIVQMLVEAGADVNAGKWPPLCQAVDENNMAIAEYLIAHGANVNAPEGWTALKEAPYIDNNVEMVELLITKGADVNAGPYTPLHAAVKKDRSDIVELLIAKGANVNAKDKSGMTPLGYTLAQNRKDNAELLLASGADFASKDENGLEVLHYAAVNGFQEIAKLCLAKGAKVDERDDVYDFTALHYAARFGTTKVAEVLIANGANVKAKDKWDYQPIHWAAYHDRPEIIELLIAKGADVNAKTSLGQTPLELAIPRRNTKTIEVLRKHGAKE